MWVTVALQAAVTHGTQIQRHKSHHIRWTSSNQGHQENEIMDIQIQQQMGTRNQEINALHLLVEQAETQQPMLLHSLISRNGSDADATPHIPQGNGDEPGKFRGAGEEYIDRLIGGRY
jgi:hypothetical protein